MTDVFTAALTALQHLPRSILVLAVIFLLCCLFLSGFSTIDNLINVLRVAAILALATYGQAIVLISGGIDFSIGSSVALCSVTTVLALQQWPLGAAFVVGFATIVLVGVINGLLIAYVRLSAFLVTLGMLLLVHGVAAIAVGGLPVEVPDREGIHTLSGGGAFGVPYPVLIAMLGAIVLHILLKKTILGRSWFLIGSNGPAAETTGIRVRRNVFLAYTVAAGFVGVAGLLLSSRVAAGEPNLYPTLPFESMAACAIGGIPLTGGRGSALNAVIGVLIVAILNNAIVLLNYPAYTQLALLGFIMIVAVIAQGGPGWKRLWWISTGISQAAAAPFRLTLRLRGNMRYTIGIVACLVAAVVFSAMFPHFGTLDNAANILSLFGPLAILSVGQMIVVLIRGFDLSVGAVFALATVIAAQATNAVGLSGLVAAPLIGLAFGLLNGLLVSYFRVQPVIATLGTLLLARGTALLAANNGQAIVIGGDSQTFLLDLQTATAGGIPLSAIFAVVVFGVVAGVLYATRFGRRLMMVGGDPYSAALVGVRVGAVTIAAYGICGLCAGVTAILIMMRTGLGLPTEGVGMEIQSLAGAVIGGTQLSGGYANPAGVFFAALFIQTTQSGLSFSGISPYAAEMVMGSSILLAGLLDRLSRRIFRTS